MNKTNANIGSDNNPLTIEQQERVTQLLKEVNFVAIKRFRVIRMTVMALLFLCGLILGPVALWLGISFHLEQSITANMLPLIIAGAIMVGGGIGGFIICFMILYIKKSPSRGITSGRLNNTLPTALMENGVIVDIFEYQKKVSMRQEQEIHLAHEINHIAYLANGGTSTGVFAREGPRFTDLSGTQGHKYVAVIYSQNLDTIFLSGWDNGNGYGNGSAIYYCPVLFEDVSFYYDPQNPKWAWIEGAKGKTKRDNDLKKAEREKFDAKLGRAGDERLEFELKHLYTRSIKTIEEVAEIRELAKTDALSQFTLACMHMFGDGVRRDLSKVLELLTKSCEQNNLFAWEAFWLFSQFSTSVKAGSEYRQLSARRSEIEKAWLDNKKNNSSKKQS